MFLTLLLLEVALPCIGLLGMNCKENLRPKFPNCGKKKVNLVTSFLKNKTKQNNLLPLVSGESWYSVRDRYLLLQRKKCVTLEHQ